MKTFEPHPMKKIEITDAKEYWQYFKCYHKNGKVWHIVTEAMSIIEQWDKIIVKLFPFYQLPIQLQVKYKSQIIRVKNANDE